MRAECFERAAQKFIHKNYNFQNILFAYYERSPCAQCDRPRRLILTLIPTINLWGAPRCCCCCADVIHGLMIILTNLYIKIFSACICEI